MESADFIELLGKDFQARLSEYRCLRDEFQNLDAERKTTRKRIDLIRKFINDIKVLDEGI